MFKAIIYTTLINCLTTNPIINPTNNITLHEYNSESLNNKNTRTKEQSSSAEIVSDSVFLTENILSMSDSGCISMESIYFDASSDFIDNTSSIKGVYTESTEFEYLNVGNSSFSSEEKLIATSNEIGFQRGKGNPFSIKNIFPFINNYTENILIVRERIVDLKKNFTKVIDEAKIRIKKLKTFPKKSKKIVK